MGDGEAVTAAEGVTVGNGGSSWSVGRGVDDGESDSADGVESAARVASTAGAGFGIIELTALQANNKMQAAAKPVSLFFIFDD